MASSGRCCTRRLSSNMSVANAVALENIATGIIACINLVVC